jgi:MFS transporter, DHA2 family, multidrug resistance protein
VSAVGGLGVLVTGLVLTTAGVSLPMPSMTDLVVGSVPLQKAGSAASVMQTGGEFGVALGVATLGSLATFVYRSRLPQTYPQMCHPGRCTTPCRASLQRPSRQHGCLGLSAAGCSPPPAMRSPPD